MDAPRVIVMGAGPAGLTAAYLLSKRGIVAEVLERDDIVGGISRTATHGGYRFDIGGHRSDAEAVEQCKLHLERLLPSLPCTQDIDSKFLERFSAREMTRAITAVFAAAHAAFNAPK